MFLATSCTDSVVVKFNLRNRTGLLVWLIASAARVQSMAQKQCHTCFKMWPTESFALNNCFLRLAGAILRFSRRCSQMSPQRPSAGNSELYMIVTIISISCFYTAYLFFKWWSILFIPWKAINQEFGLVALIHCLFKQTNGHLHNRNLILDWILVPLKIHWHKLHDTGSLI